VNSIFITGASSGFGANVATEMSRRGWHVIASMRDTSKFGAPSNRAESANSGLGGIDVITLDVTDKQSKASAAVRVLELAGGAPDAVLHCAGYTTAAFFEDLSSEKVRHIFETNFFGALDLTRSLLPAMRARGSGTIAVVSSNAVNIAHPMYSVYSSSKWAIEGWAEAMQIELAPFGLAVKILQPGNHDTPFGSNVEPILPEDSAYSHLSAVALPRMGKLGTHARPQELAVTEMCDALEDRSRRRLRFRIGRDDKAMAALARWAPYSTRRRIVERITGITAKSIGTQQ
jgi:NAD(P)-dependent dehydrogenase (short-subunit alcohol dehydrogenase family)